MNNLIEKLNDVDIEILKFLYQARYVSNSQLARLFFSSSPSTTTALRRTNRTTKNLKDLKLITNLERRIGGKRKGSSSFVFTLTNLAVKFLAQLDNNIKVSRRNSYEPSFGHLKHTLAITEIYIQLKELDQKYKRMILEKIEFEPRCWRTYSKNGVAQFLKPDLFIHLVLDEYEDFFFIELDCATESLTRVLAKSKQYIAHYNSYTEQRINGVYPLVLWIVPDEKRKIAIKNKLIDELDNYWQLFEVITLDDFKDFVYREEMEADDRY